MRHADVLPHWLLTMWPARMETQGTPCDGGKLIHDTQSRQQ